MLSIYNSLTREKEPFQPLHPPKVGMYTCGVTVYDHCHVGHGRSLYIFDVIRRYLQFRGYQVVLIRNITDIDDKMIDRARAIGQQEGISLIDAFARVRETYITSYCQDRDSLKIPPANQEPCATDNIQQMLIYIDSLIQKGSAYSRNGNVYFSIRSFPEYGKLSGKRIDELFSSVRIEEDPQKNDPLDFALWKARKNDEPYWDSQYGPGRPGWHIECSVMAQRYLGETIDIHGGGKDLIFPHHENEIAQSEAGTGKPFARYWMHHGLLTINGQKMSKSLGNFFTIKDVLRKYPEQALKLCYLQAHYSHPMDFSWRKMDESLRACERISILLNRCIQAGCVTRTFQKETFHDKSSRALFDTFIESMDDDFNMPRGLAVLFDAISLGNHLLQKPFFEKEKVQEVYDLVNGVLAIFNFDCCFEKSVQVSDEEIEALIQKRKILRRERKFKEADELRQYLQERGVILEDAQYGTTWRRSL